MNRGETGSRYESMAVAFLEQQGFQVLERSYWNRRGGIDLITKDGNCLVFVEVRYREDAGNGHPEETVGYDKQQRIRHTTEYYPYRHGLGENTVCQFDVVSILGMEIRLIRDTF